MTHVSEFDNLHFRQQQYQTAPIRIEVGELSRSPEVGRSVGRSPEPSPKKSRSASLEPQSIVMERRHFFQNHSTQQQHQQQQHQQYPQKQQQQQHHPYSHHQFGAPPTLGTLTSKSVTLTTIERVDKNGNKGAKTGKDINDPSLRASVPPSIHRASSSGSIQNVHQQISSKSTPRLSRPDRPSRLKLYRDDDAEIYMVGSKGEGRRERGEGRRDRGRLRVHQQSGRIPWQTRKL